MSRVFVNKNTEEERNLVSNFLEGKNYRKVYIVSLPSRKKGPFTIYEEEQDVLHITYSNIIIYKKAQLNIDTLILNEKYKKYLKYIPRFIVNQSTYIILKFNPDNIRVPRELLPKIKKKYYDYKSKDKILPNSNYIVWRAEDIDGINWSHVSKLFIKSNLDGLIETVKYLNCHTELEFKEVFILYDELDRDRDSTPVFDLSLLANINTKKLSINNSKYIGFRKLVATTSIPRISWTYCTILRTYESLLYEINNELRDDEPADIENNYTLVEFKCNAVYTNIYPDVVELVKRNIEISKQKRLACTKVAPII
jgi:hypothetical protein